MFFNLHHLSVIFNVLRNGKIIMVTPWSLIIPNDAYKQVKSSFGGCHEHYTVPTIVNVIILNHLKSFSLFVTSSYSTETTLIFEKVRNTSPSLVTNIKFLRKNCCVCVFDELFVMF